MATAANTPGQSVETSCSSRIAAPPGSLSNASRQRRIIAPLDPLLRNGGIILQSVGFADVQICTFLRTRF
uniref:Uncharacterized protein n=1 Tax=Agrobacterium rubi TaxID=28099 RepID=A0A2Z2PTW0_9HYPH|nr:hypothetical protein [Agrobacterium rubi]